MTTEAIKDCEAQLSQVRGRIADTLKRQEQAKRFSPSTQQMVAGTLRTLRMIEADILRDMAEVAS